MTMNKSLQQRDDIDKQYLWRKEGGRGLTGIEDSVGMRTWRRHKKAKKQHR